MRGEFASCNNFPGRQNYCPSPAVTCFTITRPACRCMTAVKYKTTIAGCSERLIPNAQRHLQTIAHRQASFAALPGAVQRTVEIADQCNFCMSQLRYEYPEGLSPPGKTQTVYLRPICSGAIHLVSGQGVGSKFDGLLLFGNYVGRSDINRFVVRAFHQS